MAGMINTLLALPSRTLSTKGTITYPDSVTQALTAAEIIDWAVTENAGDHLPLGGASASTVRLRLDNRDGEWKPGGSILGAHSLDGAVIGLEISAQHPEYSTVYSSLDGDSPTVVYAEYADGGAPGTSFGDSIDGGIPFNFPYVEWYWSDIGTYVIDKPKVTETTVELSGSDYLSNRAVRGFTDGLTYPRTVAQILQSACTQASITLKSTVFTNSSVSIPAKPLWEENTTCRDVISYVACVAGGFARIDRAGLLEIVPFDDTNDYSIGADRYITLERKTTFGALNALTVFPHGTKENAVRLATDLNEADTDQNSIAVQGNPLLRYGSTALTPLITGMFSVLEGLAFESAKTTWQGDPALKVGDVLTVTDKESTTAPILVLNQVLTFASGFGMVSENNIRTVTAGTARSMRIFTPSGRLNATALEGDINIKAGENINIVAGGKINIASDDGIVLSSGKGLETTLGDYATLTVTDDKISTAVSTKADTSALENYSTITQTASEIDLAVSTKLNANDPAAGVQTSKITIDSDSIDIASGGGVNIASGADMTISAGGNFNLAAGTGKSGIGMSNDRPDDAFIWAGSDTPANAPFRVTMDGELKASSVSGFVFPPSMGGSGYSKQIIYRGNDYPNSSIGEDGDMFVFFNGASDTSWSAQTLTYGAAGQNTYFGVNRNWNQTPTSGFYRFGNGVGSAVYDFGAYAYFTAPAATNSLTFTFVTAKYYNSTWYGYSGTTNYKVALVKSSNMAVILASATCYANQIQNTQTVTLTTAANMTQGDTYYIAVYFDGSDEKTNAGIVGSVTMQAKVSNSQTYDFLIKSNGQWYAIFGHG
ncbi:MAG: hypothetical protein EOM54_14370 [Clostridia bacterium]|nr:hypothetical protein [Clostridia bacterium]